MLKKWFLFTLVCVCCLFKTEAQQCDWLDVIGGASTDISVAHTVDDSNDMVSYSRFLSTITKGNTTLYFNGAGINIALIKYAPNGTIKWMRQVKAFDTTKHCGIFLSSIASFNNEYYIMGNSPGNLDFGNGVTIPNTLTGGSYSFLAKFNNQGIAQWVRTNTSTSATIFGGLAVDYSGNPVITFGAAGTVYFTPDDSISTGHKDQVDIIVAKYTPSGNFIWAKNFGSSSLTKKEWSRAVTTDAYDNIYIYGALDSAFTFGSQSLSEKGYALLKIDSAGNPKKAVNMAYNFNVSLSYYSGLVAFPDGRVVFSGNFKDSLDPGNSKKIYASGSTSEHTCIAFFDANLDCKWVVQEEPQSTGGFSLGSYIKISNNNIYMGGTVNAPTKLGPSIVGTTGKSVYCVIKLDTLANFLWAFSGETQGVTINSIGPDQLGDVYLTGGFRDSVDFFGVKKYAPGNFEDIFVAKLLDFKIFRGIVYPGPYCAADSITIPYTKDGRFDIGNQFIAELSDSAGKFEGEHRELGRATDTASGVIKGALPLFDVASSAKYRIRIISTKPVVQSFYKLDTLRLLIFSKDTANAGPDSTICRGQQIRLGTKGGSRWLWTPSASIPTKADTANRQPMVKPDSTTEYRIIISDSSGCGVTDTDYVKVIVRPYIDAEIVGDSMACSGFEQVLKASITGGNNKKYWRQWKSKGFNIVLSITDSLKIKPIDTVTYLLIVGDSCSDKIDTTFFTVKVDKTLNAIPSPDITICKGKSTTLTVTGDGCKPQYYKYRWFELGNPTVISNADSLIVQPLTTTTYRVILADTSSFLTDTADIKVTVDNVFNVGVTNNNTICTGQSLVLTASVFSCDTSDMEYSWDNGLGTGITKTVSPTATRTYIVTGTNKFNGLKDTASVTVTVRPPLKVTINPDTTICFGQTVELRAVTSGGDVANHNVVWSEVGGQTTANGPQTTVKPTKTTTYRAVLTDGCTVLGDSAGVTVTVRPPLKVTVNADTTICLGESAQIRASLSGGYAPAHSLLWSVVGGPWTNTNPNVTINPTQTTVYKALLSDGCTSPNDSAQITVTVRPPLKVIVNKDTTICIGENVELRATLSGGYSPSNSLLWTADSGPWTNTSSIVTVNPTQTTTYRALFTDNCTTPNDSAQITVIVRSPLSIIASAKDSICSNQILLLNSNISGGYTPSHSILWTVAGGLWTSQQNPTTDTPKITTTYIARLRDNCSPDVYDTLKVIVLAVPKADFGVLPFEGCPPLSVIFTDLSTGNDTALNTWKIQSSEVLGVREYSHEFVKSGKYGVGLTASNVLGCVDYIFKPNAVTVFDKPQAQFVAKPDIKEIESPVFLYNQSRRADSYIWNMGDGHLFTQNNTYDTMYSYTDTGSMVIKLIAQNEKGCLDTQEQLIRIHDKMNCVIPTAFTPNGDGINNTFSPVCVGVADYQMTIFNRWGETILDCKNCSWDGTYNGYAVPPGVYLYKLKINAYSKKEGTSFGTVQVIR